MSLRKTTLSRTLMAVGSSRCTCRSLTRQPGRGACLLPSSPFTHLPSIYRSSTCILFPLCRVGSSVNILIYSQPTSWTFQIDLLFLFCRFGAATWHKFYRQPTAYVNQITWPPKRVPNWIGRAKFARIPSFGFRKRNGTSVTSLEGAKWFPIGRRRSRDFAVVLNIQRGGCFMS